VCISWIVKCMIPNSPFLYISPVSAVTALSLGLYEVHKFRSNLQQNLLNYNQIIKQGERCIQLRQVIQKQYLIQNVFSIYKYIKTGTAPNLYECSYLQENTTRASSKEVCILKSTNEVNQWRRRLQHHQQQLPIYAQLRRGGSTIKFRHN